MFTWFKWIAIPLTFPLTYGPLAIDYHTKASHGVGKIIHVINHPAAFAAAEVGLKCLPSEMALGLAEEFSN